MANWWDICKFSENKRNLLRVHGALRNSSESIVFSLYESSMLRRKILVLRDA